MPFAQFNRRAAIAGMRERCIELRGQGAHTAVHQIAQGQSLTHLHPSLCFRADLPEHCAASPRNYIVEEPAVAGRGQVLQEVAN